MNNGFDAAIPPVYGEYQTGIFVPQPYHRHIDLTALELTADFGFSTVTSSSSYLANDSDAVQDLSGGYQTNLGVFYSGFPRLAVPSYRDTTEHTFTEEVRWVSATSGPLNWVLGAFYQDQRQFFSQQDDVLGWTTFASALYGVPITTDTAFQYDRWMRFRDAAMFGELTYNITDRLQVTGGVRGFDQQLDISTITQLPICGAACSNNGTDPEGTTLGSEDSSHRRVLGKLNASYHVTAETMLYATVSQGYRRGGANGLPTAGLFAQNAGFVTFGPDTVLNYEIGVKGAPSRALQFTADVFQENWNKPQLNILTPLGAFYAAVNGNTARSRGVELSVQSQVSSDLTLSAAYTYTQAELTSAFEVAGTTFGADGTRLPGVPLNEASLGADYHEPLSAHAQLHRARRHRVSGRGAGGVAGVARRLGCGPGLLDVECQLGTRAECLESRPVCRQPVEHSRDHDHDSARSRGSPPGRQLAVETAHRRESACATNFDSSPQRRELANFGSTSAARRFKLERTVAGSVRARTTDRRARILEGAQSLDTLVRFARGGKPVDPFFRHLRLHHVRPAAGDHVAKRVIDTIHVGQ